MIASSDASRWLMIAAPGSNSGKTLITMWLAAAARNQGIDTRVIKLGPDYLDSGLLGQVLGQAIINIDPWAMRTSTQLYLFTEVAKQGTLVLIESMMGILDGSSAGSASALSFANQWQIPWVLVADAKGKSHSYAAMLAGLIDACRNHPRNQPHNQLKQCSSANRVDAATDASNCGLIVNRLGSRRHLQILQQGLNRYLANYRLLAAISEQVGWSWQHTYLGLQPAAAGQASKLAKTLSYTKPLTGSAAAVIAQAQHCQYITGDNDLGGQTPFFPPPANQIAIAYDAAFRFIYPGLIQYWQSLGCKIEYFSPLADEVVAEKSTAIILPGGYPELFLEQLSNARRCKASVLEAIRQQRIIYSECGGTALLGQQLCNQDGTCYPGWGIFPFTIDYQRPKRILGYRQVQLLTSCWLGNAGTRFRGHQFHYGRINDLAQAAQVRLWQSRGADGTIFANEGYSVGNATGSFIHLLDRMS